MKVAVYGAGSWGTALAFVLAKAEHNVSLIGRNPQEINQILETRENNRFLPGVKLPDSINPTTDLEDLNTDVVVLSVPSHAIRDTAKYIKPFLKDKSILVNTAKGLELGSHKRLSEVINEELPGYPIVVLSGPSHAEEVGREVPTTVVVSSEISVAEQIQDLFMNSNFRVYTNPDIVGVELGGALKNIIALCTGVADGLGYGDNTKAALMTRGLAEIARLGVAMGGHPLTFAGLAGVGDLIVTCTSPHSRNRRAGVALGQGKPLAQVLEEVGMVVEGVRTAKAAYELSIEMGISMPITEQAYRVLYEGIDPRDAVSNLMSRGKKHELEEVAMIAHGSL